MITECELREATEFIVFLEESAQPDRRVILEKRVRPEIDFSTMSLEEITLINEQANLAHVGTAFKSFTARLGVDFPKVIKDDLLENVAFVRAALVDQEKYGTCPPPAYARRIGIILSRYKRQDLSDRFESAYQKHVVLSEVKEV